MHLNNSVNVSLINQAIAIAYMFLIYWVANFLKVNNITFIFRPGLGIIALCLLEDRETPISFSPLIFSMLYAVLLLSLYHHFKVL